MSDNDKCLNLQLFLIFDNDHLIFRSNSKKFLQITVRDRVNDAKIKSNSSQIIISWPIHNLQSHNTRLTTTACLNKYSPWKCNTYLKNKRWSTTRLSQVTVSLYFLAHAVHPWGLLCGCPWILKGVSFWTHRHKTDMITAINKYKEEESDKSQLIRLSK